MFESPVLSTDVFQSSTVISWNDETENWQKYVGTKKTLV